MIIKKNMPELETSKLMSVLADMPRVLLEGYVNRIGRPETQQDDHDPKATIDDLSSKTQAVTEKLSLKRSNSVPDFQDGDNLLRELGIEKIKAAKFETNRDNLEQQGQRKFNRSYDVLCEDETTKTEEEIQHKSILSSRDLINEDLKKLVELKKEPTIVQGDDQDLPPLLQAIIRNAKYDGKEEEHKKKLAELEAKERQELEQRSIPLKEPQYPQPTTSAQRLSNQTIVRTSDIRVSERHCVETITTKKHSTIYNDLLDEIDSSLVKSLDSNLFLGDEIKEVYAEIMKTVPTDHLYCEQDDSIEKAAEGVMLTGLMASSSLTMRRACDRMINPSLKISTEAPWGKKEDKANWSKTPANPPKDSRGQPQFDPLVPSSDNITFATDPQSGKIGGINLSDLPAMVAERMTRSYASWLTWWRQTIDSEDYMKYLATQETDYLAVINHFYDSDAENDQDEDPKSTKIEALNKELENERTKKLTNLRAKKQEYVPGMWNAQTVLLGGLGRDPNVEDDDDITRIKSAIQKEALVTQSKKKYLGDVVKERVKSGRAPSSKYDPATPRTGFISSRGATSHPDSATVRPHTGHDDRVANLLYQERMEKIWTVLHIPDNIKLDMAIKYSSDVYTDSLNEVILAWEAAISLIMQREQIISELEAFERLASDPNRFFETSYKGSSGARLKESRLRLQLHSKLENIRPRVEQAVKYIQDTYHDTVTYQGRPYLDKMKWDKIEMLHWLQEERKQHALNLHNSLSIRQQDLSKSFLIAPQS